MHKTGIIFTEIRRHKGTVNNRMQNERGEGSITNREQRLFPLRTDCQTSSRMQGNLVKSKTRLTNKDFKPNKLKTKITGK